MKIVKIKIVKMKIVKIVKMKIVKIVKWNKVSYPSLHTLAKVWYFEPSSIPNRVSKKKSEPAKPDEWLIPRALLL